MARNPKAPELALNVFNVLQIDGVIPANKWSKGAKVGLGLGVVAALGLVGGGVAYAETKPSGDESPAPSK